MSRAVGALLGGGGVQLGRGGALLGGGGVQLGRGGALFSLVDLLLEVADKATSSIRLEEK